MTKDEAIEKVIAAFTVWECECDIGDDWSEEHEACDMAINALAKESIPIEWIKERMNNIEDTMLEMAWSMLISYWEERKEE